MAINLVTKFQPYTDEQFSTESKKALITNQDLAWTGAHTIKVYKVTTSQMNDYGRNGPAQGNWSRYGAVSALDATTEEFTLKKDRSFTFAIDKLDTDETAAQLQAATALARQNREVVIPEVDAYVYGEVSETGRVLVVTPAVYALLKKSKDITMETDIGNDLRLKGVISNLDGMSVQKIPANRLPKGFGFMVAHPCATVAPVKLEDYTVHENPPLCWTTRWRLFTTRPSPTPSPRPPLRRAARHNGKTGPGLVGSTPALLLKKTHVFVTLQNLTKP